jgi:hypothetical protein
MAKGEETPRQRAKREGKPYIKIIVDTRHAIPGGTLLEMEGPHSLEQAVSTQNHLLDLMTPRKKA